MYVKLLNQMGLALTIKNYMEISSKNNKEEFEQIKPRNLGGFLPKKEESKQKQSL